MEFKHRGRMYNLERDEVIEAMRGREPERGNRNQKYFIKIDGKEYPIKQVITESLKLPKVSFTSMTAYGVLDRLGFEIIDREIEESSQRKPQK